MEWIYEALGIVGLTGIGTLYILESLNKLKKHHNAYILGNSLSSLMLAIYAYHLNSNIFLILNLLIFFGGVITYIKKQKK